MTTQTTTETSTELMARYTELQATGIYGDPATDAECKTLAATILAGDLSGKAPLKAHRITSDDLAGLLVIQPLPAAKVKPLSAVEAAAQFTSSDELRPAMTGVYHHGARTSYGASVPCFVGTCGHTLIVLPTAEAGTTNKIIHPKTGAEIDERFPDYEGAIPTGHETSPAATFTVAQVEVLRNRLTGIQKANKFADAAMGINARIMHEGQSYYACATFMLRCLTALLATGTTRIQLELYGGGKAIMFRDMDNLSKIVLVMPKIGTGYYSNKTAEITYANLLDTAEVITTEPTPPAPTRKPTKVEQQLAAALAEIETLRAALASPATATVAPAPVTSHALAEVCAEAPAEPTLETVETLADSSTVAAGIEAERPEEITRLLAETKELATKINGLDEQLAQVRAQRNATLGGLRGRSNPYVPITALAQPENTLPPTGQNPTYLTHEGVTVYHVRKYADDPSSRILSFHYTLDAAGANEFDVRELPGQNHTLSHLLTHEALRAAIDSGHLTAPQLTSPVKMKTHIKAAPLKTLSLGSQAQPDNISIANDLSHKIHAWAPKSARSFSILSAADTDYHHNDMPNQTGFMDVEVAYYTHLADGDTELIPIGFSRMFNKEFWDFKRIEGTIILHLAGNYTRPVFTPEQAKESDSLLSDEKQPFTARGRMLNECKVHAATEKRAKEMSVRTLAPTNPVKPPRRKNLFMRYQQEGDTVRVLHQVGKCAVAWIQPNRSFASRFLCIRYRQHYAVVDNMADLRFAIAELRQLDDTQVRHSEDMICVADVMAQLRVVSYNCLQSFCEAHGLDVAKSYSRANIRRAITRHRLPKAPRYLSQLNSLTTSN